ncbi:porin family protein [Cryomorphaceae bacterium 1068]|nr:porin family protein [Cryomorphaceae bacterium 1068]
MKRLFLVCSLALISYQAQSQILISLLFGDKLNSPNVEFGLEGGFSWSEMNALEANKALSSFNLGLYFDIRAKNNLWIYTGLLLKSNLGVSKLSEKDLNAIEANYYGADGTYSQTLNYFVAPLFAKYRFDNHIYVTLGPQFGLLKNGLVEFETEMDDVSTVSEQTNTDKLNRFDMGFSLGTGYTLMKGKGMSIGVRYYYGLFDVYKSISGSHNSSLYLQANIRIGAGKKKSTSDN